MAPCGLLGLMGFVCDLKVAELVSSLKICKERLTIIKDLEILGIEIYCMNCSSID